MDRGVRFAADLQQFRPTDNSKRSRTHCSIVKRIHTLCIIYTGSDRLATVETKVDVRAHVHLRSRKLQLPKRFPKRLKRQKGFHRTLKSPTNTAIPGKGGGAYKHA